MPLVGNDCEELAWLMGEAVSKDVEAWDVERAGKGATMRVTKDGQDFELSIRLAPQFERAAAE